MFEFVMGKYNYLFAIILMMIGFYAMINKKNLVKKIIGMNIFQTSIILFYISLSSKKGGATLPILEYSHGHTKEVINAVNYLNPLPHVLMLTAIVVMVATLGVAVAVIIMIYKRYNTIEEDEILKLL